MRLNDLFLADLQREAAANRRTLERVPEGRNDWKPHEKSMPLGYLASLVAVMPAWIAMIIELDDFDLTGPHREAFHPKDFATAAERLQQLDESIAKAHAALEATTEEHLMRPWRFLVAGKVMSELPRHVAIRETVFSHLAHHRGQLTVYLRLNDVPVPALYGPSADERIG